MNVLIEPGPCVALIGGASILKRRRAFILPLVLIFLLVGGALIAVSFDIADNSHQQAMQIVTSQELYNAAQSGIEWGKSQLLKHRDSLDQTTPKEYRANGHDISDLNATYTSGMFSYRVWDEKQNGKEEILSVSGVKVQVSILDCNYTVTGTPSQADALPPLMPPSTGSSGTGSGNNSGFINGTTAIMDPYRVTSSGNGGYARHYYVIRSRATHNDRTKTIETMVVING